MYIFAILVMMGALGAVMKTWDLRNRALAEIRLVSKLTEGLGSHHQREEGVRLQQQLVRSTTMRGIQHVGLVLMGMVCGYLLALIVLTS